VLFVLSEQCKPYGYISCIWVHNPELYAGVTSITFLFSSLQNCIKYLVENNGSAFIFSCLGLMLSFSNYILFCLQKDSLMELSFHIPNNNTQYIGDENHPPAQVSFFLVMTIIFFCPMYLLISCQLIFF